MFFFFSEFYLILVFIPIERQWMRLRAGAKKGKDWITFPLFMESPGSFLGFSYLWIDFVFVHVCVCLCHICVLPGVFNPLFYTSRVSLVKGSCVSINLLIFFFSFKSQSQQEILVMKFNKCEQYLFVRFKLPEMTVITEDVV